MMKLSHGLDVIRHKINRKCFHSTGAMLHKYYQTYKPSYGIDQTARDVSIVISVTTHHQRVFTCHPTIKSLLNQTMKPNRIIIYVGEDVQSIPDTLQELCSYGLEIRRVKGDIKVHTKYYYAMKEFPDAIIITADDDIIYSRRYVEKLYRWHEKFTSAVIANRVHRMLKRKNVLLPYQEWSLEDWSLRGTPSHKLFATGVSGCLYPPHVIAIKPDDAENIKAYCLNNDDIWLKFKELESDAPVVWTGSHGKLEVVLNRETGLARSNVDRNVNDEYILAMERFTGIDLRQFADEAD